MLQNYKNDQQYIYGLNAALNNYVVDLDSKNLLYRQGFIDGKQSQLNIHLKRDIRHATNFKDSCE